MISLPTNQPIVEDSNVDDFIDKGDIQVTFTYAEHEMICDLLNAAMDVMYFSTAGGLHDLPLDNEIVQRYNTVDNLRGRFQALWGDRFDSYDNL
jgi:hypothetical protein